MDESSFLRNELRLKDEQAEVARASNFKYCQGLSRELETKRQALRARLHKVAAMRNILLRQATSQRGEQAHPNLITTPNFGKPAPIDVKSASPQELDPYMKQLHRYSKSKRDQLFSISVEQLRQEQITPLIWSLITQDLLRSDLRRAIGHIKASKQEYLEGYLSAELITLLFQQSIKEDHKQGLTYLLRLARQYSFDLSHLNLARFRALLDFHLSSLGPAFDPSFATLYLEYFIHHSQCRLALKLDLQPDSNLPVILKFAAQFYKEEIPLDQEGQDILLNSVSLMAQTDQLEGAEEQVSSFLMTRVARLNSHAILHEILKNAPVKLTRRIIAKLKQFKHDHHFLPFSEDALRNFYLKHVKIQKELKCAELWAYLLKEMSMTSQLLDLTQQWENMTDQSSYIPLLYLTDAVLALNLDPNTAHKQIKATCDKFNLNQEHPVSVVSLMKAYLKQEQPELAAELATKLVKQSEAHQASLTALFKQNFGEKELTLKQFENKYGALLKRLTAQKEFQPLIQMISTVLGRKDYVSLKWLFKLFSAAHHRSALIEEVEELKIQNAPRNQFQMRMKAIVHQQSLITEAEKQLESIDTKRLKQLQRHIERKEFRVAAGQSSQLGNQLISLTGEQKNELLTGLHFQLDKPRQRLPPALYYLSRYLSQKSPSSQEETGQENEPNTGELESAHQSVIAELKGIGLKEGSPQYIALYSAGILMGKAERGELQNSIKSHIHQKDKWAFVDWMEAQSFLRVVCSWMEEHQPILKRGLYQGSFQNYVWDYVMDVERSGFLSQTVQKGLFLKTTDLSQQELGSLLQAALSSSELGQNHLLSVIKKIAGKLPKSFEKLLFKLREQKAMIRDKTSEEINLFNKLHPRDQKSKIEHHKIETQRFLSKIIHGAGLQTDLDAIRKEYNQVLDALEIPDTQLDQKSWKQEEALKAKKEEFEGQIDLELSKELLGFLMLRSRRNKIRIERLKSRIASLKKAKSLPLYKYGSAAKMFKDIVRIQYLQDYNTHAHLVSLPGIQDLEIRSTLRDRAKMLHRQIQKVRKSSKRLTLDAAKLYKKEWLKEQVEQSPHYRFDIQKQQISSEGDVRLESVHAAPGHKRQLQFHWNKAEEDLSPYTHKQEGWIHDLDFSLEDQQNKVYKIMQAVEKANLQHSPSYDRYDPHVMRQAAFNSALLSLKPLLISHLNSRKQIAQTYIKTQFAKLARESTFTPEAYDLTSTADVEIRNGQLEIKDALLSLQKISVLVDDERSPLSIALKRYSQLQQTNPLEVAEKVADQSILVEQHTLQELFSDLTEKEIIMAGLENHYLDLLLRNNTTKQELNSIIDLESVQDSGFNQVVSSAYEEYNKVMAHKNQNLEKENKCREKMGLAPLKSAQSDKTELALMRQMIGAEGTWDQYGEEMIEFGIRHQIPAAIRIGEYLMRGQPINQSLSRRVSEFLEETQIEYNEAMRLTGPLDMSQIYPGQQIKRSIWRDDYSRLGGLERLIPREKLEEIRRLDRRLG